MLPALPLDEFFTASLPGGGLVELKCCEALGLGVLLSGGFETEELNTVCRLVPKGGMAIDAGANVGVYSIALARRVGSAGRVFAFEPFPENVSRLKGNLRLSDISNVDIFPLALGEDDGEISLHITEDTAFVTTGEVGPLSTGESLQVPMSKLDTIWRQKGSPLVHLLKIDVEGAELSVLKGASGLLQTCQPILMVEANDLNHLNAITDWLSPLGYRCYRKRNFCPWNYFFISAQHESQWVE